jgi:hypothetical protein
VSLRPIGKNDAGHQLIRFQRVHVGAEIEFAGWDAACTACRARFDRRAERHRGRRQLRRRLAEGNRAADRAAIARLVMPDVAHRLHQHRQIARQSVAGDHVALPRHWPDARASSGAADARKRCDFVDIDDDEWLAHPQVEKRHQRLSTGQDGRAAARLCEDGADFVDGERGDIVERSGFHSFAPSINRRSKALSSITTGVAERRPYSKAAPATMIKSKPIASPAQSEPAAPGPRPMR